MVDTANIDSNLWRVAVMGEPEEVATVKKNNKVKVTDKTTDTLQTVMDSIKALKEREGSSLRGIMKHVLASSSNGLTEAKIYARVKKALKTGVETGLLRSVNGRGLNGRFKVKMQPKTNGVPEKGANKPTKKTEVKKTIKKTKMQSKKKTAKPKRATHVKKTGTKTPKRSMKRPAKKNSAVRGRSTARK